MKKDDGKKLTEVKKLKKLRLSRETLQPLTSSDTQKVVGGSCSECQMSPWCHQTEDACGTT
jgi:hypothetical protein